MFSVPVWDVFCFLFFHSVFSVWLCIWFCVLQYFVNLHYVRFLSMFVFHLIMVILVDLIYFIKLVYFICTVDILKCKFLPVPKQSGKHNTINESTGNACHMFQANSFQSNVLPHFNVYFCLAVIAADMQKQCRPGTVGEVGMWGIARLRILFCPSCNLLLIIIFLKME